MASDRVLVIDDNPVNLDLIVYLLEAENFAVTRCSSAEDALELYDRVLPDVLIVDVQLPGLSGLEFLRQIRGRPDGKRVCAVAVTSYAMQADRDNAYASGCDGYFTKPIDTRTFAAEVRKLQQCGNTGATAG